MRPLPPESSCSDANRSAASNVRSESRLRTPAAPEPKAAGPEREGVRGVPPDEAAATSRRNSSDEARTGCSSAMKAPSYRGRSGV
eukprot:scaffold25827_cov108-Isochrysis_galbana.AAC.1